MAAPLKLAFAVSLYFEYGGMQRTLRRIAEACVARGAEVHVYTGEWRGAPPDGIAVHRLDTRALTNVASNDRLARGLRTELLKRHYDAVIGFTKLPGLDVYYAGDPCYAARPTAWWSWANPRYRGYLRLERAVFARGLATEILLIAHQEMPKFQRHYGTEAARFHRLPPGINRVRLLGDAGERRNLRARFHMTDETLLILVVGARFKTKGLERSLRALAALPAELRARSVLVVVGGDDPKPYQRLAAALDIDRHVHFAGACADVAPYYRAADVLLHPAVHENTGTVLLEALLMGVPVLTTDNCGYAFHVARADAGRVCREPFRQDELNAQLAMLLKDAGRRAQLGENGIRYGAAHDLYSLIERATDVILARAAHNRSRSCSISATT